MSRPQLEHWPNTETKEARVRLGPDDLPEERSSKPDKWSELRARTLSDPVARERYERNFRSIVAIRRMLQLIDAERERSGLSKADLARKIGVSPATVRRLFTSPTSNPTLKTIVDLFTALDLEIQVRTHNEKNVSDNLHDACRPNVSASSVTR
jgi:ribosome-binding protein aMBF1 (putative translation factor)